MRLCPSLSLRLSAAAATAATAALALPVAPAAAATGATPSVGTVPSTVQAASCTGTDTRSFPLAARIRGGPDSYEAGGDYGTWYIDLTNSTRRTCAGIHPVVVLVDDKRSLRPGQPRLDFYDGSRARPVAFETTDEQELVGVLDGAGFAGFTVPPGGTVSVRLRLALTSDTVTDRVTASAAVVQRRGQDGDWVGASNAYRFGVGAEGEEPPDVGESVEPPGAEESEGPPAVGEVQVSPSGSASAPAAGTTSGTSAGTGTGPGTDTPDSSLPFAEEAEQAEQAEQAGERARELARTGPGLAHGLLAAGATLLAVGAGASLLTRRRH